LLTKTAIQFHIYLAEHTSPALTVITWGVKFAPTEYAILSPTIQNLAKKISKTILELSFYSKNLDFSPLTCIIIQTLTKSSK